MRELIKMVIILTILSAVSGGLLAAVRNGTINQIEAQQLKFEKAPAIRAIMSDVTNDPLKDRFKIKDGENLVNIFAGKRDGKYKFISLENYGKGFGGKVGVMVGIELDNDNIIGIGVTTHSETPGVGARAKTDPSFVEKFKGLSIKETFKVKPDGGQIDAISGATITSRGVCIGVNEATKKYMKLKPEILKQIDTLPGN